MHKSLSFIVSVTAICLMLTASTWASPPEKKKSLSDGRTLAGWHAVGEGTWTVEDGAFVGRADQTKLYGLLVSDETYSNFTVSYKFKCISGDSGFYIRTIIKKPEKAHGLQVQVGRTGSGVGGVYESYGRAWLDRPTAEEEETFLKDKDWNEMKIDARGGNIVVHVNGVKTAELKDDPGRAQGHFALQMHAGDIVRVMFKDVQIQGE
ncbi:MAG: DUF1080 domain-containing protein [Fuerstiella sp.]|nr:DUF1080 domain-containing protein [Fuerstiella sp.]MCP4857339.1 DUF1080 domain-containing protein [Fuerstiella sp.]